MSRLRHFQQTVQDQSYAAWNAGHRVVMPVMPTGAGKTVLMADTIRKHQGYGMVGAHRAELVAQISIALAREEVRHDIIGPTNLIRLIVGAHMEETGRSYYDARSNWKCASVDTIIRRDLQPRYLQQVSLVMQDEGHHVLRDNKWGKAFGMFPNARGMFPTATPIRTDGRGLGSHADGFVDALIEGPNMRWLINNGYLTDYQLLMPETSDLDLDGITIGANGELNQQELRKRTKASQRIVGDVVRTYIERASGKLGITFAVDVEHATQIAAEYNKNGVPAVVLHAETPDAERLLALRKFRNREVLQLVNVDLFGEGFDVPACEVISMVRKTNSFGLFAQQFGRALRLLISPMLAAAWDTYTSDQRLRFIAESAKPFAMIIDHVGNTIMHGGPPDWRTEPWSLDARQKRTRAVDGIPLRACVNPACLEPYERIHPACPYCGTEPPPPKDRSKPEYVDGDLVLYTPEMLQELFGAKALIDGPARIPQGAAFVVANSIKKNHRERQEAQQELRRVMALVNPPCVDERINNRRFFHTYGIDTLTAQTLGSTDAEKLRQKILEKLAIHN